MKNMILGLAIVVASSYCTNCDGPVPARPASDLTGNWAIAFDRDVICSGTMFVTQITEGLVGTFNCGTVKGIVDGDVPNGIVRITLKAMFPDGRQETMPVVGTIDSDGMAMHGSINYPFQPGVPFAARRPFSF